MKNEIISGIDFNNCTIIHRSKTEKIYLTADSKVIKFCKNVDDCRREYLILKYCQDNRYFPKVYKYGVGYIVREYIDGICLIDYIKKHSLNDDLSLLLIDLIENFTLLNFSRLDTGISHIFITKGGELKLIGLKNNYTKKEKYPKHLISGLRNLKVSKKFFKFLKKERPDLYELWKN